MAAPVLYRDLSYCGVAAQSAQGTANNTPAYYFKPVSMSVQPMPKVEMFRNGNQRDFNFGVKSEFLVKGSIKVFIYAVEFGLLMALAMGKDTKTGAGDPYTHTLDLTVDALPYATFAVGYYDGQILDRYVDCKIVKTTIDYEAGKGFYATFEWLGISVSSTHTAATVAFTDGPTYGPAWASHATFVLALIDATAQAGATTEAGVIAGQIQKAQIVLDQGIVAVPGSGQIQPIALFEGARKVSVKITPYFSGPKLHNFLNYGTIAGAGLTSAVMQGGFEMKAIVHASDRMIDLFTGPSGAVGAPTNLDWTTSNLSYSPDGKIGTMEVQGEGYRSGSNYPLSAIVTNDLSTAYF